MRRALTLAAETTALASPNPQVGCILVQTSGEGSEIIGRGAHRYQQRDHAEIVALKEARARGFDVRGATAYITLEPCSHHGRTAPCADALVAAGISRAVVATQDPNPRVRGQGIAKLRAAGIEVTLGVCQGEARDLNDAFAHFIQHRRPFVTLKAALSADGKLAPALAQRVPGQPHWLTGPAARAEVQRLRHASDAILTGIGTILADNPALTDRTGLPRRRPLLRIILDTHLRTPPGSHLLKSVSLSAPDLLILCGPEAPTANIAALEQAGAEVRSLPLQAKHLSLPPALDLLAERSCTSLLLECGSQLNGVFLSQDLVDKVVLFYAGTPLGEGAIPFAKDFDFPKHIEEHLSRVSRRPIGPDTMLTGYRHDPWHDL